MTDDKQPNDDDRDVSVEGQETEASGQEPEADEATDSKSAPENREEEGPFDDDEANPARPYVDLGGIKVLPREGLHLRLEIDDATKTVVAVGLDLGRSTLQVQPFASPRSSGLWHEIRGQIVEQIAQQGGKTQEQSGPFGPELLAEIPVVSSEGTVNEVRPARFIGVDGPRWFLRGVIAGEAVEKPETAKDIEDLFRSLVVVRGSHPMPPRDLIPLHVPATATEQAPPTEQESNTGNDES